MAGSSSDPVPCSARLSARAPAPPPAGRARWSWLAAALVATMSFSGCGGGNGMSPPPPPPPDAAPPAPMVAFSLPSDPSAPIPIPDIPFPNDALLGQNGKLQITAATLPFDKNADPAVIKTMAEAFQADSCFGGSSPGVIFPLVNVTDADNIDPSTLTAKTVELISLADGSTLPVEIDYRATDKQIYLRPQRGIALAQGGQYAAVVTTGVATGSGVSLTEAPDLAAALSASSPGAAPARLRRAATALAPLEQYLGNGAPPADKIAGATVFTTCKYTALATVRQQLAQMPAPAVKVAHIYAGASELDSFLGTPADNTAPGADNPGGIAHADIGYVVLGTFPSPNYQSAVPDKLGVWQDGPTGAPMVKGTDQVPFLLALPGGLSSYANLPVIVFQHGLNSSRAAVLAVANSLTARGFAVIGIDIPFHGDRFPDAVDMKHNFGTTPGPDGLADDTSYGPSLLFFDFQGADGFGALDPRVIAGSFQQAMVDMMSESILIKSGDFSAIGKSESALAGLSFNAGRVVYSSESFGSIIGAAMLAFEPNYQAAFLSVGGGGILNQLLENSPTYGQLFLPVVEGKFGLSANDVAYDVSPPHTNYAFVMFSMLLAEADPLTYAPLLQHKGVNVVMANAVADESVPNQASEALAAAIGLQLAPVDSARTSALPYVPASAIPATTIPVSGNVTVDGKALTAAYFELDPATHGMITHAHGQRKYMAPFPPFVPRTTPEQVDNPTAALLRRLGDYADTYVKTGTPTLTH